MLWFVFGVRLIVLCCLFCRRVKERRPWLQRRPCKSSSRCRMSTWASRWERHSSQYSTTWNWTPVSELSPVKTECSLLRIWHPLIIVKPLSSFLIRRDFVPASAFENRLPWDGGHPRQKLQRVFRVLPQQTQWVPGTRSSSGEDRQVINLFFS